MFRFIILFVALVAGGGAAWAVFAMRSEPAAPVVVQETPPPATRDILVATTDLAPGQILAKEGMHWQSWPESAVLPAYISRSTRPDAMVSMVGATVRGRMIAGEPIRDDKLGIATVGLLSSMLPAGKRAVAVRITAEKTAGGFILPNDRVDVLHTVESQDKADSPKDYTARTILSNIVVLAVDQTLNEAKDEKAKAKTSAVGKTATLELDRRQAEVLVAAEASGTISLALRSVADSAEIAPAPPKAPEPVKVAAPEPVVVLRGSSGGGGAAAAAGAAAGAGAPKSP